MQTENLGSISVLCFLGGLLGNGEEIFTISNRGLIFSLYAYCFIFKAYTRVMGEGYEKILCFCVSFFIVGH